MKTLERITRQYKGFIPLRKKGEIVFTLSHVFQMLQEMAEQSFNAAREFDTDTKKDKYKGYWDYHKDIEI